MPIVILLILLSCPFYTFANDYYPSDNNYHPAVNNLFEELEDLHDLPEQISNDYSKETLNLDNMPVVDEVKLTESSVDKRRLRKSHNSFKLDDKEEIIEIEGENTSNPPITNNKKKRRKRGF